MMGLSQTMKDYYIYLGYVTRALLAMAVIWALASPTPAKIGVDRLHVNLEITPGQSKTGSFWVIHSGKEPEEVSISLRDWTKDINDTNILSKPGTCPRSLAKWIDFSPITFVLEGGQKQEVTFTITIPEEERGPHWLMFIVESNSKITREFESKERKFVFTISMAYGIKIRQTDPEMALDKGRITNMSIIVVNPGDSSFKVKVEFENAGTTFLEPSGRVEFRDEKGEVVDKIDVESFRILPEGKRVLELSYEGEKLSPGEYLALAIIDFGGDYLVAGQRKFEIK